MRAPKAWRAPVLWQSACLRFFARVRLSLGLLIAVAVWLIAPDSALLRCDLDRSAQPYLTDRCASRLAGFFSVIYIMRVLPDDRRALLQALGPACESLSQTRRGCAWSAAGGGSFASMGAWSPQMNYHFNELKRVRSCRDSSNSGHFCPTMLAAF